MRFSQKNIIQGEFPSRLREEDRSRPPGAGNLFRQSQKATREVSARHQKESTFPLRRKD